jgi:RimJ/RimL family protein N-acetyltransferase
MTGLEDFPQPPRLHTARVALEPQQVDHAAEMAELLDDPELHAFIGGTPATQLELTERYRRQSVGWSPDRCQRWLNWVVRRRADHQIVGTVQATVSAQDHLLAAEVAWVVATAHQGRGYAKEAASTMVRWLRAHGVAVVIAHIHPDHHASQAVAQAVGLASTGMVLDGEERWQG